MANKLAVDYIKTALEQGHSKDDISQALLAQNWTQTDIDAAFNQVESASAQLNNTLTAPAAPKKSEWDIDLNSLSASQILLYLGGLIVVLAAVFYVSMFWSAWSPLGRVMAIFAPTIICLIAGAILFHHVNYKKQGVVFLTVGATLFPFFLWVMYFEMQILAVSDIGVLGLVIALPSLALCLILGLFFPFPVWTTFSQIAGLLVYYYSVLMILPEPSSTVWGWLLLIPGALYLWLSLYFEKKALTAEAFYSYLLGSLVAGFSIVLLLFGANSFGYYALIPLGMLYFLAGVYFETKGVLKYSHSGYIIGAGAIIFALLALASQGFIVQHLIEGFGAQPYPEMGNDYSSERYAIYHENLKMYIGWSNVLAGGLYFAFGWAIGLLKNRGLKEPERFKDAAEFLGILSVLGGIHYLGLGGSSPVYETLLLLASLVCIFASVIELSRKSLYLGTLFLVVYIFSTTSEYFATNVGWPVSLFVAGLLSMGVSVLIERFRKSYFVKN